MVIRAIAKIKFFIPPESLCTIVCSLVLQKLDYCNALYYGINKNEIALLQSVQNAAIRLIDGRYKYDRVPLSPVYERLHWLKIEERVLFKLCLIMHKCVWGLAPEAFTEMVVLSNPRTMKVVEKDFSTSYGKRAFSCAGPKVWNCLPVKIREERNIKVFKKLLRSQLMMDPDRIYKLLTMR